MPAIPTIAAATKFLVNQARKGDGGASFLSKDRFKKVQTKSSNPIKQIGRTLRPAARAVRSIGKFFGFGAYTRHRPTGHAVGGDYNGYAARRRVHVSHRPRDRVTIPRYLPMHHYNARRDGTHFGRRLYRSVR